MVGWIKMKLGMEVGLGPGHIGLDGDSALSPQKAQPRHPIFGPCLLWPNGWMDEDATWYGGRLWPRRHCVIRWGSSFPLKGAHHPHHFSAHVYCGQKMGDGGGGHWLVRMEWCPAGWSVCLPLLIFCCTIKSRSSLLAPAHPGGPGKRAIKWLWWWWSIVANGHPFQLLLSTCWHLILASAFFFFYIAVCKFLYFVVCWFMILVVAVMSCNTKGCLIMLCCFLITGLLPLPTYKM